MEIGDALAWLDSHVNLETGGLSEKRVMAPSLDRIRALSRLLGSPELEYPALHVTGTNGKTTATRLSAALLAATGLSVGAYTSPHLSDVNERMMCNGEVIGDGELADNLSRVALIEAHLGDRPTFFEILTACALSWFADIAVDAAVVEVGLGGTWDATNVVDGRVAAVTNVSIDHVEYLGRDLAQIAGEKAGIVKPGATLVLGETDPALVPLFEERGAARVVRRGVDFGVGSQRLAVGGRLIDIYTPGAAYTDLLLPLHGAHQADNAAIALTAAECLLGAQLDAELVAEVFAAFRSPGRLEIVGRQPLVLLDGAHNIAGARALRTALADEFVAASRVYVVGLLREKDPREMLEALGVSATERIVCCRPPSPRARDPRDLAVAARDLGLDPSSIEVVENADDAVMHAIALAGTDHQVVVTGSLYLVGAARRTLVTNG